MKKLLIISLISIVALTGCGDKTDDLENQNTKTATAEKESLQTTKLETKSIGSIIEGKNFLSLEYDEDKYDLAQFKNEKTIYLMDKATHSNFCVSIKHMESKDIQTAANEYLKKSKNNRNSATDKDLEFLPESTEAESDLDVSSIKIINTYKNDNPSNEVYFIDDNEGGSYYLSIQFGKKDDYFTNIKILPKVGNENTMNNIIQLSPSIG